MKGLGPYPEISLRDARIMRDEIQTARAKGLSPVSPALFGDAVEEWLKVRMEGKAETYTQIHRLGLGRKLEREKDE